MQSFLSSHTGDPVLDRRLDWARGYLEAGDPAAAVDILADAVAQAPDFAAAWFLLGEAREAAGQSDVAITAYRRVLELLPEDKLGAGLRIARLGGGAVEGAMSEAYVRTLFDQYAPKFDHALREKLAYRGPEILRAAVDAACVGLGRPVAFARAVDLGCGTGLAAEAFGDCVGALWGVDLSPAMVALAQRTGRYAGAEVGDMAEFLAAQPPGSADLILAADALCYLSRLDGVFGAAARALKPGGLFAFTVETHEGEGLLLRDTLRYAHARAFVTDAVEAAGLITLQLGAASSRSEKGEPVQGLVAVLMRPGRA